MLKKLHFLATNLIHVNSSDQHKYKDNFYSKKSYQNIKLTLAGQKINDHPVFHHNTQESFSHVPPQKENEQPFLQRNMNERCKNSIMA